MTGSASTRTTEILGVKVPLVTMPVAPAATSDAGRVAARNQLLRTEAVTRRVCSPSGWNVLWSNSRIGRSTIRAGGAVTSRRKRAAADGGRPDSLS
jgi:hypothetical protein